MIISTEEGPAVPRGNGQGISTYPQTQPSANFQPGYPQNRPSNYPQQQPPMINQPIYPQRNPPPSLGYSTPSKFENNQKYLPAEPNMNSNIPVTQRPADPANLSGEVNNWPDLTTATLFTTTQKPTQGQSNFGDDDDDGPIQIIMGKK